MGRNRGKPSGSRRQSLNVMDDYEPTFAVTKLPTSGDEQTHLFEVDLSPLTPAVRRRVSNNMRDAKENSVRLKGPLLRFAVEETPSHAQETANAMFNRALKIGTGR